jgi:hypothetical protein
MAFPFIDRGAFYIFDPNASEREITEMLGYWQEYTSWTDEDYYKMLDEYFKLSDTSLTIIPRIVEKSVFESLMESMPGYNGDYSGEVFGRPISRTLAKMYAYYALVTDDIIAWQQHYFADYHFTGELVTQTAMFPYSDKGDFYVYDFFSSEREIAEILGYWNEYTSWTDVDYFKMLVDYGIVVY